MNKQEFFEELERHDWTYSYSDDSRAYNRGMENWKRLKEIASQSEELEQLLDDYRLWYWDHLSTGTMTIQKPMVDRS